MIGLIKAVDRVMSAVCMLLTALLAVTVFVSVVLRYVFSIVFIQSEEAITLLFVGITYFGVALAEREQDHINIPYFRDKVKGVPRKVLNVVISLVTAFVAWTTFRHSLSWIQRTGSVPSPATRIPTGYYYLVVPVTAAVLLFYSLVNIAANFLPVPEPDRGYRLDQDVEEAKQ